VFSEAAWRQNAESFGALMSETIDASMPERCWRTIESTSKATSRPRGSKTLRYLRGVSPTANLPVIRCRPTGFDADFPFTGPDSRAARAVAAIFRAFALIAAEFRGEATSDA
jgi:hypothetical protein